MLDVRDFGSRIKSFVIIRLAGVAAYRGAVCQRFGDAGLFGRSGLSRRSTFIWDDKTRVCEKGGALKNEFCWVSVQLKVCCWVYQWPDSCPVRSSLV